MIHVSIEGVGEYVLENVKAQGFEIRSTGIAVNTIRDLGELADTLAEDDGSCGIAIKDGKWFVAFGVPSDFEVILRW